MTKQLRAELARRAQLEAEQAAALEARQRALAEQFDAADEELEELQLEELQRWQSHLLRRMRSWSELSQRRNGTSGCSSASRRRRPARWPRYCHALTPRRWWGC